MVANRFEQPKHAKRVGVGCIFGLLERHRHVRLRGHVGVIEVDASYTINADYRDIAVYGLLILLFVLRPTGLFGTRLVEKV